MSRKAASKGSSELGYVGHPRSVFGWSGSDGSARAKDLFMAANVVEEFLINAELVAVDIQRVLLADESNPGPSSAKVWALLRSNAGTMAAAILMLARTLPRPCPRLPEACQLHGPITRSRRSQAPTTPPNAVSHLAFSRPRAGTSPTSVCGSTASTGGGQDGAAALQSRPGCPWLERHHLEHAGFLAGGRPGHANDGDGHIRHQQPARLQHTRPITKRVKTRPLNCSQSSSATPNSATTARNSLR